MFNPHFFTSLFFGNHDALVDTMRLVSAFKVEEDLQRNWREERERQSQSNVEHIPEERARVKAFPFSV